MLARALVVLHGRGSTLAISIGAVKKGKMSVVIYAIAIPLALWQPLVAGGCYAIVALMWLVPDRRIENLLA